jgi:hypothetical protein
MNQSESENIISKQLLSAFIDTFFGYGNLDAPYWFVGKEEGGGKDLVENFRRVLTWEALGKGMTVDSIDNHQRLGFSEHQLTRIQPTWTKLIQILLVLEGKDPLSKDLRREYQRHRLGRLSGDNCCVELMPMASRSTSLWLWHEIFLKHFGYKDRNDYFSQVCPNRRARLKELISMHKPKVVVFYSSQQNYISEWSLISGVDKWNWINISQAFKYGWAEKDGTLFIITPHPTMHGIKNTDFPVVGEFIKKFIT